MDKIEKSMLLITSSWQKEPTFKMIPLALDCPYVECIYIPQNKVLAVISKTPKQNMTMVPKLDDNGDPMFLKEGRKRQDGTPYKEERRIVDSYQEYYIEKREEIMDFVSMFADNINGFDYGQYLTVKQEVPAGEISIPS